MKHLITIAMLLAAIIAADAQYYYPYDSSNYYLDDAPSLIIQKDPIMNSWYVSDLDGRRISDYYAQIRPYSQGAAAVRDHIMGWCFINLSGRRFSDYYDAVDDFHEGYALVKDKIMGWTFIDGTGRRLVNDYFKDAYPFHRGLALVQDHVMGWYLLNTAGRRITDYHDSPADFKPASRPRRPW